VGPGPVFIHWAGRRSEILIYCRCRRTLAEDIAMILLLSEVIFLFLLNIHLSIFFYYYYYLVCETIGTATTLGLLCQPRVIMKMVMEKQMECRLAGETEVFGENLPQRNFCPSQNPT
jgi:hypothetical protein